MIGLVSSQCEGRLNAFSKWMQPSICTFHRPRGHACRDSAGIPIFLSVQIWNGKWKVSHSFPSTICKAVIQVPNSCNWIRLRQDFSDESLVRSWRWRCLWSLERRQHMVPLRTCRLDNIGQTSASTELWISMDCCPLLSNIFQYEIFKQIYKATAVCKPWTQIHPVGRLV